MKVNSSYPWSIHNFEVLYKITSCDKPSFREQHKQMLAENEELSRALSAQAAANQALEKENSKLDAVIDQGHKTRQQLQQHLDDQRQTSHTLVAGRRQLEATTSEPSKVDSNIGARDG